jgi:hypothetical protein
MIFNISYKKTKGNVIDNYISTLRGWKNKDVTWKNMRKVVCDSSIQYSCYEWNNGVKKSKQWTNDKQNMIILDIDDGMTISEAQSMFSRYMYLIATTKSHQKEKKGIICDRFRILLPAINIPRESDLYFKTIEIMFPMNDVQTLTRTSAFLGNDNAIHIYNDGDMIDCHKASIIASEELKEVKPIPTIDKDLLDSYSSSIGDLKEELTREIVLDIVESLGYEVSYNKFKLREERTHSAKVYHQGFIKDYGGTFSGDVFNLLQEYHGMSFSDAVKYVRRYM